MHIPDGVLSPTVAGTMIIAAGSSVGIAAARLRGRLTSDMAPLIGVLGAFVFAAQNVKVPLGPLSAGHLDGGALIAILLGPAAAVVTIFSVLVVQLLLAGDGGLFALGANTWNMAIADAVVAFVVFRVLAPARAVGPRFYIAAGVAAFSGVFAAAFCCAAQISLSAPAASRSALFGGIIGAHVVVGGGEALLTVVSLRALSRLAPTLLDRSSFAAIAPSVSAARGAQREWISILLLSLVLGSIVAYFASKLPDALEHTFLRHGIEGSGPHAAAPFPEYETPGVGSEFLSGAIAAAIGVVVVLALLAATLYLLRARRRGRG